MEKSEQINVEQWKLADKAYAKLIDLTVAEALNKLHAMRDLDDTVKSKVMTLISNGNQSSQILNQHFSAGFGLSKRAEDVFQIGDEVGGYELLQQIGAGGMAKVYLAKKKDAQSQKPAAIKIFNHSSLSEVMLDRFAVEQEILSSLSHPHIVNMFHSGRTVQDVPFIVMELIEGATDIDEYARSNSTPLRQKIKWVLEAAMAIAYAHNNMIIHRDIKPSNLLIDENKQLKVVDFGIAKLMSKVKASHKTTIMALTPTYASPEQINAGQISVATDVFSLAAVCLTLVSDQEPLPSDRLLKSCSGDEAHIWQVLKSHVDDKDLRNILNKALHQDPLKRYHNMDTFAEDLSAWLSNKPVSATGNSLFYQVKKFAKRRVALFTTLMTSLATLIFMLFVLSWQYQATIKEKQRAIEIKNFMLDLFASADPEKNSDGKLKAVDLLNIASMQVKNRYEENPEIKAEILTSIGSAFISLGSVYDGEQLLLNSLAFDPNNINTQLELVDHYIASSQMEKSTAIINQLETLNLSADGLDQLNLDLLKAWSHLIKGELSDAIVLARATQKQYVKLNHIQGMVRSTEILSSALLSIDKPQEAIKTISNVTNKIQNTQISDSLGYIKLKKLLSVVYRNTDDLDQSLTQINETINYIEKHLGLNHPLYITSAIEKARTYRDLKKYTKALESAQKAYDVATQMYGEESKLTQHAIYGQVSIHRAKGDMVQAIGLMKQVVELSEQNYGPDHFITINGSFEVAVLMFDNDQKLEAINFVLELKEQLITQFGNTNEHAIHATNTYIDFMQRINQAESVSELLKLNHLNAINNLADGHKQITYSKNLLQKLQGN